ncbi:MAG: DNA polymerase III subunit alpha [Verrucomicrobiia bacterium]
MQRSIVHLDADAFFASVEQAADSRLRGKPIAVGGEKRGIIASASYEARRFGIYTPMPTVRARRLCPKLIVLPGDYEKYERFSRWMFSYAYDFTPDVEIGSIDEGYFDLTGARKPPETIAEKIRNAIRQSLKITVSEGIGSNKLVSQIASKLNKPAAFAQVPPGQETAFLHPLANRWLPGIGPKTSETLNSAGLARIGQIALTPVDLLSLLLGGLAIQIKEFANGRDDRPVLREAAPAKSYSQQETFAADTTDETFVEATLRRMADELTSKVRQDGKSIRTVTVKVRYNDMAEDQRSQSLAEPTDLESDIYSLLHPMLRQAWKRRVSLRMVSLKFSNLYEGFVRTELPLETDTQQHEARRRLSHVIDELRRSHGRAVIMRGHDMLLAGKLRKERARASPPVHRDQSSQTLCYVPLNVRSYYSFLDSTLSIQAIIGLAKRYELPAVAITDKSNLHGAVEFVQAAKEAGIKPIIGAEMRWGNSPLLLYVQNVAGYRNLCRLLTRGGHRSYSTDHVDTDGLIAIGSDPRLADRFPNRFYLESEVAVPVIRYAEPADRWRFDVVQSIRTLTLLREEHPEKRLAGEYHFPTPAEMRMAYRGREDALARTREIADRCAFDFEIGKLQFPAFVPPDGSTPREFLRRLVLEGLRRRYPTRHEAVQQQVEEELVIIAEVGYEEYFLVIWDILQECRRRGIEWITRGSAADSLVCYCLGISDVCPIRFDLYFRRFINRDRMALNKLPDIDLDFPHDRKDDVIDLIFEKYGTEHTAVVGGFSTYQARSAFADVAKVLGVSEYQVRRFTERIPHAAARDLVEAVANSQEAHDLPVEEEPYKAALKMAQFLDGFPRYPKMHPCGVVLSRSRMTDLVPCFASAKGYPTTHFDMDSVEAIGLVKIDILAQGGLAVMRDVKQALAQRGIEVDLQSLEPWQDPNVWEMIATGGARAVHHIESPAMISLCRMCNVREIDGLIAIVSVIRPGAANEQKKVRFTCRYQGFEPVVYPHPSLEQCLKSTFGMVVYEEHILQICEAFAGLPPGRADVLRRALGKQQWEKAEQIGHEFAACARKLGRTEAEIAEVWNLVSGFSGYAFCKAHSTAYGVEAYQAAWLKRYYPAEFMAAVLSNGKGFYQPLVYVLECHRLGIPLLPPWVNDTGPMFTVRDGKIRVPAVRVKGLNERTQARIIQERQRGKFSSLEDFCKRVGVPGEELELLLRVGAFDGFGRSRTAQFWQIQHLMRGGRNSDQGWLLADSSRDRVPPVALSEPTRLERLKAEFELLDFTASGHPLELHPDIAWETYCPVAELGKHVGEKITCCGLIVEDRIHQQVTGELMKFLTLADWTGIVETELFADTYKSYGLATVRYPVLEVTATVEPFENGNGYLLRVLRAGKPRTTCSS